MKPRAATRSFPPQLRALLHDPSLGADPRVLQFLEELDSDDIRHVSRFLNKAADFEFSADQAFYLWFKIPRDEGILRFVGGQVGAMSLFMKHGGRELFDWLKSDRGMKWLLDKNAENLKLFLDYISRM